VAKSKCHSGSFTSFHWPRTNRWPASFDNYLLGAPRRARLILLFPEETNGVEDAEGKESSVDGAERRLPVLGRHMVVRAMMSDAIFVFHFAGLLLSLTATTAPCAHAQASSESAGTRGSASVDVEEGDTVTLGCRFGRHLAAARGTTLYWIRTNRRGHDNVAISGTPFEENYRSVAIKMRVVCSKKCTFLRSRRAISMGNRGTCCMFTAFNGSSPSIPGLALISSLPGSSERASAANSVRSLGPPPIIIGDCQAGQPLTKAGRASEWRRHGQKYITRRGRKEKGILRILRRR